MEVDSTQTLSPILHHHGSSSSPASRVTPPLAAVQEEGNVDEEDKDDEEKRRQYERRGQDQQHSGHELAEEDDVEDHLMDDSMELGEDGEEDETPEASAAATLASVAHGGSIASNSASASAAAAAAALAAPTAGIGGSTTSALPHPLPPGYNKDQPICANCSTQTTPLWRRSHDSTHILCNACALFFKMKGRPRPISLKTDVIKSRNRSKGKSTSKDRMGGGVGGIVAGGGASGSTVSSASSTSVSGSKTSKERSESHSRSREEGSISGKKSAPGGSNNMDEDDSESETGRSNKFGDTVSDLGWEQAAAGGKKARKSGSSSSSYGMMPPVPAGYGPPPPGAYPYPTYGYQHPHAPHPHPHTHPHQHQPYPSRSRSRSTSTSRRAHSLDGRPGYIRGGSSSTEDATRASAGTGSGLGGPPPPAPGNPYNYGAPPMGYHAAGAGLHPTPEGGYYPYYAPPYGGSYPGQAPYGYPPAPHYGQGGGGLHPHAVHLQGPALTHAQSDSRSRSPAAAASSSVQSQRTPSSDTRDSSPRSSASPPQGPQGYSTLHSSTGYPHQPTNPSGLSYGFGPGHERYTNNSSNSSGGGTATNESSSRTQPPTKSSPSTNNANVAVSTSPTGHSIRLPSVEAITHVQANGRVTLAPIVGSGSSPRSNHSTVDPGSGGVNTNTSSGAGGSTGPGGRVSLPPIGSMSHHNNSNPHHHQQQQQAGRSLLGNTTGSGPGQMPLVPRHTALFEMRSSSEPASGKPSLIGSGGGNVIGSGGRNKGSGVLSSGVVIGSHASSQPSSIGSPQSRPRGASISSNSAASVSGSSEGGVNSPDSSNRNVPLPPSAAWVGPANISTSMSNTSQSHGWPTPPLPEDERRGRSERRFDDFNSPMGMKGTGLVPGAGSRANRNGQDETLDEVDELEGDDGVDVPSGGGSNDGRGVLSGVGANGHDHRRMIGVETGLGELRVADPSHHGAGLQHYSYHAVHGSPGSIGGGIKNEDSSRSRSSGKEERGRSRIQLSNRSQSQSTSRARGRGSSTSASSGRPPSISAEAEIARLKTRVSELTFMNNLMQSRLRQLEEPGQVPPTPIASAAEIGDEQEDNENETMADQLEEADEDGEGTIHGHVQGRHEDKYFHSVGVSGGGSLERTGEPEDDEFSPLAKDPVMRARFLEFLKQNERTTTTTPTPTTTTTPIGHRLNTEATQ